MVRCEEGLSLLNRRLLQSRQSRCLTMELLSRFCGACWAFSAVGAIEGARAIKTGNLTDLSMQQLLDCDDTDMGCGGGLMNWAFQYDEDAVGLCSLDQYPYAYREFFSCVCLIGLFVCLILTNLTSLRSALVLGLQPICAILHAAL